MAIILGVVPGSIENLPTINTFKLPNRAYTKTGLIIPLYTYPTSTTWTKVASVKSTYPSVPMLVIINPSDGPGTSQDSNYVNGIQKLQSVGITVLGYVSTGYAQKSLSEVSSDINSYATFYPSMNGIFFDEMSTLISAVIYYQDACEYAISNGFIYTIGNPGAKTSTSYISTVNNLVIYESKGLPSLTSLRYLGYDKSHFSVIAYGVSTLDKSYVKSLTSYVQYMYITNDNLPNPYDSLPPYFNELAGTLDTDCN